MKRTSTLFLFIFSCCMLPGIVNAQILIQYEDYPKPESFELLRFQADPENIEPPTIGEDQLWDYSNLQPIGTINSTVLNAEGDPNFPNAKYVSHGQLSFQNFLFNVSSYEALDENGVYLMGQITADTTFSITPVSGGPNDILRFVGTPEHFEGRLNIIKFPMTYGDTWTETRKERIPFELTVAAFGMDRVPGWRTRTVTQTRTVSGWGQVITPNRDGNPNPPRDVLLMWIEGITVDSFFLGGAPAPQPIMDAFGLIQGEEFNNSFTLFYDQYDVSNLMRANIAADGSISSVFFKPDHNPISSVRNLSLNPAFVFPNPVSPLQDLTIRTEQPISNGKILLFDMNGKTVYSRDVHSSSGQEFGITIPTHLSSGMHIFQLTDENGEIKSVGRITVH